ncbi:MAG: N-acetylmuramoyl-L-alanine amidase [Clostridia bacterium]|nr:N-acetylmuramoyl-L-alanine amidase [Clostridia bacterium]
MLGHGLPDQGTSSINGVTEQAINLAIALKLQSFLEQAGATVILTRSDDNGIYKLDAKSIREKKISDINNRVEIGNQEGVDIYVAIHLNYYEQEKYSGWQTFYQDNLEDSKQLANIIQQEMNNNFNKENNRTPMPIKGVYIMDHVKSPAVIVECGFLSNKEEEKLLQQESYQNDLAWGMYVGIQKYFTEICSYN